MSALDVLKALDRLVRCGVGDVSLCLTEDGDIGAYHADGAYGSGVGDTAEEALAQLFKNVEGGAS